MNFVKLEDGQLLNLDLVIRIKLANSEEQRKNIYAYVFLFGKKDYFTVDQQNYNRIWDKIHFEQKAEIDRHNELITKLDQLKNRVVSMSLGDK